MTNTEALLTNARRYCIDQYQYWTLRYSKEKSGNNTPYSDNDYNLFPRYNVLDVILHELEKLVGQSFSSLENCKEQLKRVGISSQSIFINGEQNPIALKAMQEERTKFVKHIERLTEQDIQHARPLPYRRRLAESEARDIRQTLDHVWGYDGHWVPLHEKAKGEYIFLMKEYLTKNDYTLISQFIKEHSENKLLELTEGRLDYEIEHDSFNPDCYETIFTDSSFSWVVYGSHESTLAFGGENLLTFIRQLFSDRQENLNKWEQNW